ncbi:MAG TPA: helix-turn-helix transcriptional regulator [Verrucomicrobiae bacterium]|jgi:transcriptional regulator with XRE-family HTH domain|nr:helix-turn-helix transcriptional regulator [Verrucomicrobiae bacterium]
MKFEITKEQARRIAKFEGDDVIGAGIPQFAEAGRASASVLDLAPELRLAFGRLIGLMRRNLRMSAEELADQADVDLAEVISIEQDTHFVPEPRTVYQLARQFKLPEGRLMELAGLATPRDIGFAREAVRFAARSESIAKLTVEERSALEEFTALISSVK